MEEEQEKRVRELDEPWTRTITCDQDITDFCDRADEMAHAIYAECGGRTFFFEGFQVRQDGATTIITFNWGS